MQNRRLEPTGLTNPDRTSGLMGTGLGLACQQGVGQILRLVWNQTYLCLWSQPGQLAGYPDLLLTQYTRNNMNSKLNDITNCKTCIHRVLDVELVILILYYYQTAKTGALYESTAGPAGQPAANPPNVHKLRDFNWTILKLMVLVNWQPGQPNWQQLGFDPHPDPKQQSRTIANTCYYDTQLISSHTWWPILLWAFDTMATNTYFINQGMPQSSNTITHKKFHLQCDWGLILTGSEPISTS